jgi:hypothetical protein
MVETNPVHPDLRKEVKEAMDNNADVSLRGTSSPRDGYIRQYSGIIHTVKFDKYSVAGVSENANHTLIHVKRDDS